MCFFLDFFSRKEWKKNSWTLLFSMDRCVSITCSIEIRNSKEPKPLECGIGNNDEKQWEYSLFPKFAFIFVSFFYGSNIFLILVIFGVRILYECLRFLSFLLFFFFSSVNRIHCSSTYTVHVCDPFFFSFSYFISIVSFFSCSFVATYSLFKGKHFDSKEWCGCATIKVVEESQ